MIKKIQDFYKASNLIKWELLFNRPPVVRNANGHVMAWPSRMQTRQMSKLRKNHVQIATVTKDKGASRTLVMLCVPFLQVTGHVLTLPVSQQPHN